MKDLKEFRMINEREQQFILNSISSFSSKILDNLKGLDYILWIHLGNSHSKNSFPEIYLIPISVANKIKNIKNVNSIKSAGLYFGFVKMGQFFLSLEGAEFLFNKRLYTENQILYVSSKGEKSILYGNSILKHMCLKIPLKIEKNSILIVLNESDEILSLAKSQITYEDYQNFTSKDKVAINLIDKGYYLRKKQ